VEDDREGASRDSAVLVPGGVFSLILASRKCREVGRRAETSLCIEFGYCLLGKTFEISFVRRRRQSTASKENKTCFVIAPLGEPDSEIRKRSDQILKYVIQPAARGCGYEALRVDHNVSGFGEGRASG